jgi:hypothetical protein
MRRIFIGATLIIAGIAAFIEAHTHAPSYMYVCRLVNGEACPEGRHFVEAGEHVERQVSALEPGALAQTPYDLLRIGAWALVIFGAALLLVGLIGYWRKAA